MLGFFLVIILIPSPIVSAGPKEYLCYRSAETIVIDGNLDEASWRKAPVTDDFVDIEGDARPRPRFATGARMLWDDQYFYIGAELDEPHVWGTLTKRDSVIFHDNDFEVFIDPNGDRDEYYELEINALNTVWDLFLPKPYMDGGKAQGSWDILGLKTAVKVMGTLNDPSDVDKGWSVEMAIPWRALGEYAHKPAPPGDGDQWRVNFSRVEWRHEIADGKYRKTPNTKEDNWVWSPQGVINMHVPEKWGYVRFTKVAVGKEKTQ
jgi:Carbohydrate family 9 binding domain-like